MSWKCCASVCPFVYESPTAIYTHLIHKEKINFHNYSFHRIFVSGFSSLSEGGWEIPFTQQFRQEIFNWKKIDGRRIASFFIFFLLRFCFFFSTFFLLFIFLLLEYTKQKHYHLKRSSHVEFGSCTLFTESRDDVARTIAKGKQKSKMNSFFYSFPGKLNDEKTKETENFLIAIVSMLVRHQSHGIEHDHTHRCRSWKGCLTLIRTQTQRQKKRRPFTNSVQLIPCENLFICFW